MAAIACPHCGASVAGPELPGQIIACRDCGSLIRPGPSPGGVAPPPASRRPRSSDAWASDPAEGLTEPWTADPAAQQPPAPDRIVDAAVPLPFDPLEKAEEKPRSVPHWRSVRVLSAAAVFLVALIGAVIVARNIRPWMARGPTVSAASIREAVGRLRSASEVQRGEAAGALVAMGPEALAVAVEEITAIDRSKDRVRFESSAVLALTDTGDEGARALAEVLASPRPEARIGATVALREMGSRGRGALDRLIEALADPEPWVRRLAIEAIGNMGAEAEPAVPALAGLLEHAEVSVRNRAAAALARIGPAAQAAAAALERVEKNDTDAAIRRAAGVALRQVRLEDRARQSWREARGEQRRLIRRLIGEDEEAAVAAAARLGKMGHAALDAVPALTLALRHSNPQRREAAARTLGNLGLLASESLPALQVAVREVNADVRAAALEAIRQIEGPSS